MNELVSGLYELDGQSIDSNGATTNCVVSYGSKKQPILYGLPSGATWPVQRVGSAHRRPPPFAIFGSKSAFGVCGIGWVLAVLTSGELLCGTLTSLTGTTGLPVR